MDLVENLTNVSLKELQPDLDELLAEPKKEEKEKKKSSSSPVGNPLKGFAEALRSMGHALGAFKPSGPGGYKFKKIKEKAQSTALKQCLTIYDIYKKAHGMVTW